MIDRRYVINLTRFSTLVSELCGKGKVFEAEELFKEMSKSCPIIDVDIYRRVTDECIVIFNPLE